MCVSVGLTMCQCARGRCPRRGVAHLPSWVRGTGAWTSGTHRILLRSPSSIVPSHHPPCTAPTPPAARERSEARRMAQQSNRKAGIPRSARFLYCGSGASKTLKHLPLIYHRSIFLLIFAAARDRITKPSWRRDAQAELRRTPAFLFFISRKFL